MRQITSTSPTINLTEAPQNGRNGWERGFELADGREGRILWDGRFTGEGATDLHLSVQLRADQQRQIGAVPLYVAIPDFRVDGEQAELLRQMEEDEKAAQVIAAAGLVTLLPRQLQLEDIEPQHAFAS